MPLFCSFSRFFSVECGWPGVGRGLRVEVEVLDDERTSTPAVFKDLGQCLTLLAAALCRLVVVIGVICSLTWKVSIRFLSLGVSVVWCSTESPVIAALAARVVG